MESSNMSEWFRRGSSCQRLRKAGRGYVFLAAKSPWLKALRLKYSVRVLQTPCL